MATISKETLKTLADTIAVVKLIEQADKKIQPQYKRMYDGLKAAIDNGSEDEIELYRPQLEKLGAAIDTSLESIQRALGLLAQLRKDDALMEAKFDQIEKLVKLVAGKRKTLAEQAAAARKLDAEADKALGIAKKDAESAEGDLGALQAQVATLMKTIHDIDTNAPKLADAARKAHARKDQKTLTDSRVKLIDYLQYGSAATAIRPRVDKYKKQYPDISREMKAEVQYLLDDIQHAEDSIKAVDKLVKELLALKQVQKDEEPAKRPEIPKSEIAKAAKALGIEAKDLGKLAKVLNETPRSRWATELGKLATTLKLKETEGREMVVKINKIDYFRKATLIDI